MARKKSNATPATAEQPRLYLTAEGVVKEAGTDEPVVFADSGARHEMLARMVESYNALLPYSREQIAKGEFRGGVRVSGRNAVQLGNGNTML